MEGDRRVIEVPPDLLGKKKPKASHESNLSKEARLLREVALLSLLHHPHIVSLYGYSVTPSYYILFMELVEGGPLLNYIITHGRLKESKAREFFRQLLSAVHYCHYNSIVHRDLKIENILIDNQNQLKVIDFGLSNFYDNSVMLKTVCGSLYYAAPELLSGKPYTGPEVDVWSLGVILFVLCTGKVPFDDKKLPVLHDKIKAGHVEYPSYLSPELRHLLSRMITVHPHQRANLQELLHHVWVNKGYDGAPPNSFLPVRLPLDTLDAKVVLGIVQTLGGQYTPDLVTRILYMAIQDWTIYEHHPIVSLYYLVKEKLRRWHDTQSKEHSLSQSFGKNIRSLGHTHTLSHYSIPSTSNVPPSYHHPRMPRAPEPAHTAFSRSIRTTSLYSPKDLTGGRVGVRSLTRPLEALDLSSSAPTRPPMQRPHLPMEETASQDETTQTKRPVSPSSKSSKLSTWFPRWMTGVMRPFKAKPPSK